jgi:hypothetical protein
MRHEKDIVIKQSPFIFIKYLVVVEFLFVFTPLFALWLFQVDESYETVALAQTLSFNWLIAIVMTSFQVLVLSLTFVTWYFPTYHINHKEVIYSRGGLYHDTKVAELSHVEEIAVRQGWLGKRLNYGNLLLAGGNAAEPAKLRNVPDPSGYLVQINELHRQETVSLADGEQPLLAASMSLPLLIEGGENQNVEFKASLLWDYRQQKATKELYTPVMKNIVAFLNSGGGVVLIGVGDEGEILGIEPDLRTLQKQNLDGFENAFNMAFRKMIGDEFRQSVNVTFPEIDGSTICRLTVSPLSEPAYLLYQGDERFYIRAGNASQPLPVSKATNYVRTHFKG